MNVNVSGRGGLITSLMLNEDYVVHVLGFKRSTLTEGRYNMQLQQDILHAHLLAENWFKQGIKDLKKAGVKGWEAVKDKALEVPNAIKKFGKDTTGIVAALTAMVKDPEEAKEYATGIFASVRLWPKRINKSLKTIEKWMEDHSMPTFAKGVGKIRDMLITLWKAAQNAKGWIKSISMMAFGLAVKYVEEEFGIKEKLGKLIDYIGDPEEIVVDIKDALGEIGEGVLDDVKDFFKGEITAVVENSDLFKQITSFLSEKLGFLQAMKDKFFNLGKKIIGSAVEQFAGPLAWLKQAYELFGKASWVIGHLAPMLVKIKIM